MRRNRTYRRRNKLVHLEELSDLVAMHPPEGEPAGGPAPAAKRMSGKDLDAIAPDVSLPQVRAFEASGWVLMSRKASEEIPENAVQAKVFVQAGGRLALSTDKLTVKFSHDVSEKEADEILRPYGCRTVERLTFAPGLFRAALEGPGAGDVLDVANALSDSELVEFAEPELIEVTGQRG